MAFKNPKLFVHGFYVLSMPTGIVVPNLDIERKPLSPSTILGNPTRLTEPVQSFRLDVRRDAGRNAAEVAVRLPRHLAGGTTLPVITRLRFGMLKMKATTDDALMRASAP